MTVRAGRTEERGVGVISSSLGFLMAMTFLLMGVHVVLALHVRTIVRAAAWDAARAVARDPAHDRAAGEDRITTLIGGLEPQLHWSDGQGGSLQLEVTVRRPGLVPFGVLSDLATTRAVVEVRREGWR